MPHCLFTWNVITHSGNPTRYGCACQWPCHQKAHKTEHVCRQDRGYITSKAASRVSHLARFQSWWSSFSHSSIKYPIHQWYKLPVCVCVLCLSIPCGQPNWQLLPTNKKTNCKYLIPCRSDGQAASVLNANSKDKRDAPSQVLIDCIPVKRQLFSCFLGHYPETECMDQCTNPRNSGFSAKNWQSSKC